MKGLTDIDGILVGHTTDLEAITGCTVILGPPGGMAAGVDVRGMASGAMQLDWDFSRGDHLEPVFPVYATLDMVRALT